MSTWDRLKRVVRSNLERFRDDPLLAREVNSLAQNVATVRELLSELEADLEGLKRQEERISARIKQSLQAGDREVALDEADRLRRVREDIARVNARLETARQACARAEGVHRQAQRELDESADLKHRAEATVSRLEREVANGEPEPEGSGGAKTLGTDSGPSPLAEETPRSERRKTMGGADDDDDRSSAVETRAASKTIGPAPVASVPDREQSSAGSSGDLLDELERLGKLKEQGLLTADEFDAAKRKLLG